MVEMDFETKLKTTRISILGLLRPLIPTAITAIIYVAIFGWSYLNKGFELTMVAIGIAILVQLGVRR